MTNMTTGEIISTCRKDKGMTQKDLAELLNVTDKAVSKWERNLSYPDTGLLPRLAEILGVSVETLLGGSPVVTSGHKDAAYLLPLILKAVPLAMGISVAILAALGKLELQSGLSMLGIGMACISLCLLNPKN